MPTETTWVVPVATDLNKVLSQLALVSEDANVGANVQTGQQTNPINPLRSAELLRMAVARIRGAVTKGGRCPVSLTASSVPPDAEQHALVLSARGMTGATPLLDTVVKVGGTTSPLGSLVTIAEKWITDTTAGAPVVAPSNSPLDINGNPTLDPTGNLAVSSVGFGDQYGNEFTYAQPGNPSPPAPAPFDMNTYG